MSRSIIASSALTWTETRGYRTVEIATPYHSTWLDNTKAKFLLGWRPQYDLKRMIDAAFDYQRAATTRAWSGIRAEIVRGYASETAL